MFIYINNKRAAFSNVLRECELREKNILVATLFSWAKNNELSSVMQAAALVEEETRRYRPTKNYLSYLPTPDFSAFEVTKKKPTQAPWILLTTLISGTKWTALIFKIFFYYPSDRNYEEWIWASGSAAANGTPEHEKVKCAHYSSPCWCLELQKSWVKGKDVSVCPPRYIHSCWKSVMKNIAIL